MGLGLGGVGCDVLTSVSICSRNGGSVNHGVGVWCGGVGHVHVRVNLLTQRTLRESEVISESRKRQGLG